MADHFTRGRILKFIILLIVSGLLPINAKAQQDCPPDVPCGAVLRFTEHGAVRWRDEQGVLDHLASSFRQSSDHVIHFLIYAGLRSCKDEARLRALRAKKYLVQHHKIPPAVITWRDGGFREELSVWIYLLPKDKPLPEPSTFITIDRTAVRFSRNCKEFKQRK